MTTESHRTLRVAIIGMGPRGLTVFERLCANLAEESPSVKVTAHLVDATRVGTGTVWRTNQPGHLLMNTVASQVTVFTDTSVMMSGPVVPGPSVYEWATYLVKIGPLGPVTDQVLAEARDMTPDTYPTRSFYGHYLRWAFEHVASRHNRHIHVVEHHAWAVDVTDGTGGRQCVTLDTGRQLPELDAVVLTQGHLAVERTSDLEISAMSSHAAASGANYLPPQNAADADLSQIAAGEPLLIRGLGLTFFDYMTLLTVGRGGTMITTAGGLRYVPSGSEPRIYAGSRRGVPYHSRGRNQKGVDGRHTPRLLTSDVIESLRQRSRRYHDVDFRRDVWPLIAAEVECVYYGLLVQDRLSPNAISEMQSRYLAASELDRPRVLADYNIEPHLQWSWTALLDPAAGRQFSSSNAYRDWVVSYLCRDVALARQGNLRGAVKAALDVLRDLRNEVRLIVDHAGVTGDSYREHLDRWYTPSNAFLSIGPPAHKIEELIALIRAGVVTLIGPRATFTADSDGGFTASSGEVPGSTVHAASLLDARLPEPDIRRTSDILLQRLLARGDARPYVLTNPDGSTYETGGLDVAERNHSIISATGTPHPRRFALGVPTESVRWVTAAGPRPGVNSVTLADADAIARSILTFGTRRSTVAA